MNAYNIISFLRRGYFIFPSGVFEKRLCEVAKNNKSTSQEDTEKCRRLIEYAFGEGKFPKEYIKGFEHINLDDEEDVNEFAQTLAVDTNVSDKASPEEKLLKYIDKIFGVDRAGCEEHFEGIHSEGEKNKKTIVISKDVDNIFAQNTPVCLKKVVVFRPTWPPQDCSYKNPTGFVENVQEISNNYTRCNEKKNKKEKENNVHHEILDTTTILEDNIPPISLDHRVMIEPHIDIYADEEEDLIFQQNVDNNVEMAESEQEHMRFNLIVYSQEKTEPGQRNQSQKSSTILTYQNDDKNYTSGPIETEHSQHSCTISPHHDINIESKNIIKIDPVEVDATGLEKIILNSLINKTVGSKNPFPYRVKWETCQNFLGSSKETCETETTREAYLATAKVSKLEQLKEETIHLDPPTVETIARFDTQMPEKGSIPYCATHSFNIGQHGEIWNEQSANAKVHLEPPTIENISRLDCLEKETINLDPPEVKDTSKFDLLSVKIKKPETKVVWKELETIMEPVMTPKQKRWLDITNPRLKPKTIRLNPLKVENINEKKEESQKPENWKDFEKIAVPIPSSQETSMPNFANIGTKFIKSKECTLTTLKDKIKSHNITKKQIDDLVKTDFSSNPRVREQTLLDSKTRQLQIDHEKDLNTIKAAEKNGVPASGDVKQVEKSHSKSVFAAHQRKSNLPVSRETPSMHLKDLIMQVISRQPYNEKNKHDSSVTLNEFVHIGNSQDLSNKDQAAITELSPCRICKTEKHSSQAEKREGESQHEEIRPLDLNNETVNNEIKPARAETINKAKIEDIDEEEEDYVGAYIFPTENNRKNRGDTTETIKGTKKKNFGVTVGKMNQKVNEDSPLTTTDKKPIKDIKAKIENKANVVETSLTPEYKAKHRFKAYASCNKENPLIPLHNVYSYFPCQCCHYVNCHNFYQQNDPRYVIGLAAKYRHYYYPCYQSHTNQNYGFYGPLEPYINQTHAFYKTSVNRPKNTIRKAGIETKIHKNANQLLDIKTVVSTQANIEMDKQKQANNLINTVTRARGNNEMEKLQQVNNSHESDKNTIVSARAYNETDKHSNNSLKSDIKPMLSSQINVEMDKHTEPKKIDIIKTLVSTRASHEMDIHTYVKIPQVQTITSAELDLSKKRRRTQGKQVDLTKIPTKTIHGKENMRTRAEHALKNRMPIETSVQRQVRLRSKPKLENEILGDKPEPSDLLEKDLPLSVLLERVRERNRKEQVLKNLRLIEGEQKTKKSGRDKSPPSPTCPPLEPPRSSPPTSLPPSGDNVPKFCPPKWKNSSKFFEMLSTLSVYDNDSPNERSITSGKRRQLEKRLLGDVGVGVVGINRWIFVQDKALPWSDSETENILECSRQSLDENDVKNLWFKNIF